MNYTTLIIYGMILYENNKTIKFISVNIINMILYISYSYNITLIPRKIYLFIKGDAYIMYYSILQ